jgi:hypothetical protein
LWQFAIGGKKGGKIRAWLPRPWQVFQMTRCYCALVAILCACLTHVNVRAQEPFDLLESEEVAVEVDLLDEGETDTALWTPEFLSAGAFADWASRGHVYSSVDFAALSASDEAFNTDGDFVMTPRFQLGWESDSGWGVRGTYWNLENDSFDHPFGWDMEPGTNVVNLDLDVYRRLEVGNSFVTVGGGLKSVQGKWQEYKILDEITFAQNGLFAGTYKEQTVEGVGPSLFAEIQRPMFVHATLQVAFFTGGRTSFIPTDYSESESSIGYPTVNQSDDDLWINEGNVGVELSRRLQRFVVRLRGQFEAQAWNSSVMDDQAFTGVSTSLGVEW